MSNMKNFVGEYAYNTIKNVAVDNEKIRQALVTPQNARAVFSELSEFQIKSLCSEISNSGTIGQIRNTTQQEIVNAFNAAGYDNVIFDDEDAIALCRKFYRHDEVICTYNNLNSRMCEYHMLVAIKKNIDKIERSKNPSREDEYGTSILNIQIARNGSHMSIKNRYNHTVSQPDSTLNNNLDMIYQGLQSMVLGYYGFASLNKAKTHYDNIINIGDVYLKYHAEKNNIYFGTFVLDGANGVRFNDASRYYVTKGLDCNSHYNNPLVLDFKDKKTIDVSQSKEKSSYKAPLLSRAMREDILTSGNKDEADTLTATFPDAKKELLQCRKNALKYIHEAYGYDFTKPYIVTGFLGKFTAKSIEKTTGSDTGILLISSEGEMRVCEMSNGIFYAKDLRRIYNSKIDTFYRQSDFEAARKSGCAAVYVIQQEQQYIGKPKPEERASYYYGRKNEKPEIDKSGHNVTEVREELERKLRQYKTEKRAKEASEIDYTQDIADITKSFTELKAEIIARLTKANTVEDYSILGNVMDYKLTWLVRDIKDVRKNAANKNFKSVDSANQMINDIKVKIISLKNKLYEEGVA
ncbi:MAG: hypothetical protein RSF40_01545 [Oscillospiraceae bacterium]